MNEEALQYSYSLFTNDGYNGSFEDFQKLINENKEALDYSFNLFTNDGYNGSVEDYSSLMGIGSVDTTEQPAVETKAPESLDEYISSWENSIKSIGENISNAIKPEAKERVKKSFQDASDLNLQFEHNVDKTYDSLPKEAKELLSKQDVKNILSQVDADKAYDEINKIVESYASSQTGMIGDLASSAAAIGLGFNVDDLVTGEAAFNLFSTIENNFSDWKEQEQAIIDYNTGKQEEKEETLISKYDTGSLDESIQTNDKLINSNKIILEQLELMKSQGQDVDQNKINQVTSNIASLEQEKNTLNTEKSEKEQEIKEFDGKLATLLRKKNPNMSDKDVALNIEKFKSDRSLDYINPLSEYTTFDMESGYFDVLGIESRKQLKKDLNLTEDEVNEFIEETGAFLRSKNITYQKSLKDSSYISNYLQTQEKLDIPVSENLINEMSDTDYSEMDLINAMEKDGIFHGELFYNKTEEQVAPMLNDLFNRFGINVYAGVSGKDMSAMDIAASVALGTTVDLDRLGNNITIQASNGKSIVLNTNQSRMGQAHYNAKKLKNFIKENGELQPLEDIDKIQARSDFGLNLIEDKYIQRRTKEIELSNNAIADSMEKFNKEFETLQAEHDSKIEAARQEIEELTKSGASQEQVAARSKELINNIIKEEAEINNYVASKNKEFEIAGYTLKDNKKTISKNLQSILKMNSKLGSMEQALVHSTLKGVEDLAVGIEYMLYAGALATNPLTYIASAYHGEDIFQKEMKEFTEKVIEPTQGSITQFGTLPSEAYVQAQMDTVLGGGILGLAQSLPAILGSVATGGGSLGVAFFGAQAAGATLEEINSSPELKDIPESEKFLLMGLIGASTGVLEEFGLSTILGKNKLLNTIALRALKKMPVNGTTTTLKKLMREELRSGFANFTVPMLSGTAVEATTGTTQAIAESGIKEVYEQIKGGVNDKGDRINWFQTELDVLREKGWTSLEGWKDIMSAWAKAGAQEAIGGFVMSMPGGISQSINANNMKDVSLRKYAIYKTFGRNKEAMENLIQAVAISETQGEITDPEAKKLVRDLNKFQNILRSVPETISLNNQKVYFDLLSEKMSIEETVKQNKELGVEVTQETNNRLDEINKEIEFYNSKPDIKLTNNIINTANLAKSLGKDVKFVVSKNDKEAIDSFRNFVKNNPDGKVALTGEDSKIKLSQATEVDILESAESNGFILYDANETPYAFINRERAIRSKEGLVVASHEVLHALENSVIDPEKRTQINEMLLGELSKSNKEILESTLNERYPDKTERDIEYFTVLQDLIKSKQIKLDKGLKDRLGRFINKLIPFVSKKGNKELQSFLKEGFDNSAEAVDFILSYTDSIDNARNKLTFEEKQQILNSKYEGKPVAGEVVQEAPVVEEAPVIEEVKEEPAKAIELQEKRDTDEALKKQDQTKLTEKQKKEKQLEAAMARDITAKEDVAEEEVKAVENKSRRSVEASMRGKGFEFEGKNYKYKQAKDKKGYFLVVDGVAQKKKVARVENVSKMFSELTGYEFKDADKKAPVKKKPTKKAPAKKIQVKGQTNIESKLKGIKFAEKVATALSGLKAEDGKIAFFDIFKGNEVTLEGIDTFSKSDLTLDAVKRIKDYAVEKGWMKVKKPSTKAIDAPIDTEKKVGITKSRSTSKDRRSEYSKQRRDNKEISRFNEDIIYEIIRENESMIGDEMVDQIIEGNIQRLKGELYNNNIGRITLEAKKAYDKGFAVDPTTRITMEEFMSGFTLEFNELIRTYLNKVLDGKFREVPFGAYVSENLPRRYAQILDALKKQFEGAELTGITEEAASKRDLALIETERKVEQLEKSLRKELGLDNNFKERVFDKVKRVFKGRLPHPSDPAFKSTLEQEFERELFDTIREDLFGAKFNEEKNRYMYNWNFIEEKLNEYAEAIYDKLPIQTIVSLNRQTWNKGEPIMKPIIDPKTGEVKRMTPEESDKAQELFGITEPKDRKAGNLIFAKIDPSKVKDDFVNFFLNPVVSRKAMRMEGLFKVLAKEIAFDATMEVLRDPETIERVEALYELQDIELLGNEMEIISKELNRSIGLTFSKSVARDQGIENIIGNRNFNSRLRVSINEFLDQKFNKVDDYVEFKDVIRNNGLNLEELNNQELEELETFNNKINSIVNDSITIKNKGKGSIHSLNDRVEDYVDSSFYLKDIKDITGIDFTIQDLVGINGEVNNESEKLIVSILKTLSIQDIKNITANLRKGIYNGQLIQILTTTANIKESINNNEKIWKSTIPGRDDKSPKNLILNNNNTSKTEEQVVNILKAREKNGVMTRNLAIKFLSELQKKYNNEKTKTEKVKKKYIGVILWLANAGGMQSILRTSYTNGLVQNSIFEIRKNLEKITNTKKFNKLSVEKQNEEIKKFFDKRKNKILFEHRPPLNILTKKVTSYIFNNETNDNLVSFLENEAKINTVDRLFGDAVDKFYKTTESLFGDQYIYNPNVMLEYVSLLKDSGVKILDNSTLSMIPYKKVINAKSKLKTQSISINKNAQKTYKERVKQQQEAKKVNDLSLTKSKVVKPTASMTNQDVLSLAATLDEALRIARDPDAPVKKIRIFDFDDTLAQTKSNVLYTLPDGTTGKLTAEEFAKKGDKMAAEGAIWDFSEFNKVMEGKKGPLFKVAQAIQEARGTKDVFVLTARAPEAAVAIKEFLDSVGLNIPIENITGLGDSSPFAKSQWVVEKAAEGYNDFYFADDAYKNVKAVQDALSVIDVKSRTQQAKLGLTRSAKSNLNETFNLIIEAKTGIAAEKTFDEIAKGIGKKKGRYKFFIPYSAEDFTGLMYPLLAKGKLGDKQMEWFNEVLFNPFARAMNDVSSDRNQLMRDFIEIKKNLKNVPKNLRKEAMPGLTYENAVRIYLWDKQGFDVPGLNEETMGNVWELMQEKPELQAFADQLLAINKGDGFAKPDQTWMAGTITTDLLRGLNTTKRKKYLEQWQRNVDIIFSKENLLKLEAVYGKKYVEALKDSLRRMKTGVNRKSSIGVHEQRWLDWVNGSVGVTMFFNMRSALLQTISTINYVNWSDNNPAKVAATFAKPKRFRRDFLTLFNSEFLVDRRNGLRINISESEIADAASQSSNPYKAITNLILQKGFSLTQFADSLAIAFGGSSFYRNRIKTYIKQGLSESEAEKKAFQDFREITEESQQSSRPDRISQQQASGVGRVILAFANTPMQYARLMKKAFIDLKNGRGDWKTNLSKIAYYGFVQNFIFNALQQALFALSFDDEYEEEEKKKYISTANGMLDSILRGLGYAGAAVSIAKNTLLKLYEESEKDRPKYENVAFEILNLSPPIDAKITRFRDAMRTLQYEMDEIKEKGFSLDNPAYEASAKVFTMITNVPLDRLFTKMENMEAAVNEDYEVWQRIALWLGWSEWSIQTPEQKEKAQAERKAEGQANRKNTLKEKTKKKQQQLIELGF